MDYEQRHPILQEVYEYLKNTPKEQIEEDWSYVFKETYPTESYYEQKYKEALERARDLMTNQNPPAFDKHLIEMVFPELKMSEEERIKKALIKILNEIVINTNYKELGIDYNIRDIIAWLEKQGENKLTDKVEPKFKVGDKVTMKGDNTIYTIGIIAPDKTCWLKHGSRAYGWATFGVLKHYVE